MKIETRRDDVNTPLLGRYQLRITLDFVLAPEEHIEVVGRNRSVGCADLETILQLSPVATVVIREQRVVSDQTGPVATNLSRKRHRAHQAIGRVIDCRRRIRVEPAPFDSSIALSESIAETESTA